jgi:hypothetical protein
MVKGDDGIDFVVQMIVLLCAVSRKSIIDFGKLIRSGEGEKATEKGVDFGRIEHVYVSSWLNNGIRADKKYLGPL